MYATKLQAKNEKLRKELEDEKAKVVELGNDIDDQSSLLESTTNAQKSSRHRQETHAFAGKSFPGKDNHYHLQFCSFLYLQVTFCLI